MTLRLSKGKFKIKDKKSLWKNKTLYDLYKKSAMLSGGIKKIINRCNKKGLICFSTPFDENLLIF